jgi:dTMP kinase
VYIAIDGIRCCGKSTQVAELEKRIRLNYPQLPLLVTKEPGGTEKSEIMRHVLVDPPESKGSALLPRTNILLFAASRCQTVGEKIAPALARGEMVLSDRCVLSSDCYQGYGDLDENCDYGWQYIHRLNNWAVGGVFPDLVIVPEISPELSKERVEERAVRDNLYDKKPLEYYQRVSFAYKKLGELLKGHIWMIDGTKPVEQQADLIWGRVEPTIGENIETRREMMVRRERE